MPLTDKQLAANHALADGFGRTSKQGNSFALLMRYKGQAERLYRRAVEDFDRLKALRQELPNEPISDLQPEENEPDYMPPDEPFFNPEWNPQPEPTGDMEQAIVPGAVPGAVNQHPTSDIQHPS